MKTGRELLKKSNQFDKLSKKINADVTTLAQKAVVLQKVIKKTLIAKLSDKKTCENMSGTYCVLHIIQNSEKGVDPRTLKSMTGMNKKKVHKILYKLFKHGEVRIEGGGLYAGVKSAFKAGGETMHYRE